MNYIILDLEYNQAYPFSRQATPSLAACPFEIIQIGAIKMNHRMDILDSFDRLIKPQIYTHMHPYVERITGLNASLLSRGISFRDGYAQFLAFIQGEPAVFCAWGRDDMINLYKNITYYKLPLPADDLRFINIQLLASQYLEQPANRSIGLKNAAQRLGLPITATFHDALHDALYTAEIFKRVKKKNMPVHVLFGTNTN